MVTKLRTKKTYEDNNGSNAVLSSFAIVENSKRIENVLILQGDGSLEASVARSTRNLQRTKYILILLQILQ
jgi:hypothetical protein